MMAFFIIIYVGQVFPQQMASQCFNLIRFDSVEVTLGGWIVSYIIDVRGGGPSSGYISSGFWGGLALGRVGLIWLNRLLGDRSAVFLYGILIIAYEKHFALSPNADRDLARV
jgi:fucose permease